MSNSLYRNDTRIWRCSNTKLDAIYETMMELVNNKNLSHESSIRKFIERLDQNTYGSGCISIDLADHLKTHDEIHQFAVLFKEAIELLNKKFEWPEESFQHALDLYRTLTKN